MNNLLMFLTCPYSDNDTIMSIFVIARMVVQALQIVVPIALIIWGTIDIGKAVIAGDEKKIKEAQKPFVKRVIAAVVVFLIPFLVSVILGYVSNGEWKDCWTEAKDRNITEINTGDDYGVQ